MPAGFPRSSSAEGEVRLPSPSKSACWMEGIRFVAVKLNQSAIV
jgi:hypothetical protein